MLTEPQKQAFDSLGIAKLPQYIPQALIAQARAPVFRALRKLGVYSDNGWQLDNVQLPNPKQLRKVITSISEAAPYDMVVTPELRDVISGLLDDEPTSDMLDRAQLMFTWPTANEWIVPHNVWHLDLPRVGELRTPGIQVFAFLDTVAHGGGGTLVVAGSHRLFSDGFQCNSKELKRHLRDEPYFRDLWSKTTPNRDQFHKVVGRCRDTEIQVVEMTGEPGDVYLVDMRLLHAPAPCVGRRPRIMLTQRLVRESIMAECFA